MNAELLTIEARQDAARYLRANRVLDVLRKCYLRHRIDAATYKRLRAMALDGDIEAAQKELGDILLFDDK